MAETTIPILPCQTLPPVLEFYTALGFEVTFHQKSPNPYAVVVRGGVQLHFFGMKQYDPAASHSTCLVCTDDVDELHGAFRAGLKSAYGRVPIRGLPRIGPVGDTSHGVRQFLMTDPGGNCLRIVQPIDDDQSHRPSPEEPFAKALYHAALLADSKEDLTAAARILDRALEKEDEQPPPATLFRLLVLRTDLAHRTADTAAAAGLTARARATAAELTDEERVLLDDDFRRLEQLAP
ncbi:VOC family protein [Streptomyces sp. BE20]|uniref:bleomycin resistance protein n=1 Tax=Streptomyces sp. BE20 TaxID=3002525 RepID=UPI002E7725C4|nr:VOC family protein [Streptomyces sp. BE20]MEE1824601.1 VOC family protein [Streptomyces sp. BE20]